MIPVPIGVRVWLATGHTDMCRDFASLSLLVREVLRRPSVLLSRTPRRPHDIQHTVCVMRRSSIRGAPSLGWSFRSRIIGAAKSSLRSIPISSRATRVRRRLGYSTQASAPE